MAYQGIADFRSDTVTRPSAAMLEAMVSAPLGDAVLGDDPTVKELEAFAAESFGKEAALYLPSGTMANQVAIRAHCRLGDEILLEQSCHVFMWEQGGAAQLSTTSARSRIDGGSRSMSMAPALLTRAPHRVTPCASTARARTPSAAVSRRGSAHRSAASSRAVPSSSGAPTGRARCSAAG